MSAIDELLNSNEAFARGFEQGGVPAAPGRRLAVVACMDARLDPVAALGLASGDAHVIRNAGGVVTDDVIRSLSISQHLLGTEEVMLIHHTECGMLASDDAEFERRLEREAGVRPEWRPGFFPHLEQSVRESVRRVVESPFVPRADRVRGFVYDVHSGRLREVEPRASG